jgi:peptidoglycan hydrolase-like protein with peptidoglycan-binding domain
MLTPTQAEEVAEWIVNAEARRDKQGKLRVYKLPAADGGGTFEIAGINDRYHPEVAEKLRGMIEEGRAYQAEGVARNYISRYTDVVQKWGVANAAEAYLRDCCWNRGPKGALRILQRAIGVADDGKFGPATKAAVREFCTFRALGQLKALCSARQAYEKRVAPPVGKRAAFWKGLLNRFDNAVTMALGFV